MTPTNLDNTLLEAAVRDRFGPELGGIRSAALARLAATGLPTTRDEAWKYTSLDGVAEIGNRWLADEAATAATGAVAATPPDDIDADWLVFRDGRIDEDALDRAAGELDGRVRLSRLSASDGGAEVFMDDAMSSLNAALMEDAVCIEVAPRAVLERPLGFLLEDRAGDTARISPLRLLIRLGAGASAEFIEIHRSSGAGAHVASLVTELELALSAEARYARVQERSQEDTLITRVQARLERDSRFEHASIDLGGRLVRNDITATIVGPGAAFRTSGVFLAEGRQHIDNHICADHRVGPALSSQVYRGIASGRARCVFNGKAVVSEGADGTDAEQSNHNLLLSDKAEIDTKPELEIYADDVKCSHGATVGQLDPSALFYLRSRGLSRDRARRILTRAFAGSVLAGIPVAGVREHAAAATDRKLDSLEEDENA